MTADHLPLEDCLHAACAMRANESLRAFAAGRRFGTIYADPPWRFSNRTGKMAPEHRRLARYATMTQQEIFELPVPQLALPESHLYLWFRTRSSEKGSR
jgi:N6-adenosine-specific RNA methylase IME4